MSIPYIDIPVDDTSYFVMPLNIVPATVFWTVSGVFFAQFAFIVLSTMVDPYFDGYTLIDVVLYNQRLNIAF